MTKRDVIDGWKSISEYVSKSVKTVQRWERESGFPIHRVPGRRSVFALKDEVDNWILSNMAEYSGAETPYKNEKKTQNRLLNRLFQPRFVSLAIFILILLVFGALTVQHTGSQNSVALGPLSVKIVPYSEGSLLTVTNARKKLVFKIKFNQNLCEFALRTPGTRLWRIKDVNGDGLDDFLFVNRQKERPEISLMLQNFNGKLELKRTLIITETIHYQGIRYEMQGIQSFNLADLDGDHLPELLISTSHASLYPSMLVVMTLKGERLLVVEHPGWFRNSVVRTVKGTKVLYVAGTNNFISKYSEPVLVRISMDWHRRGVRFSLLRPGRKMAETVPKGISLTYARFGDFPELPGISLWEAAVIRPHFSGTYGDHLLVEAGHCDTNKVKALLPGNVAGEYKKIRQFELKSDLSLIWAQYNDVVEDALKIHPSKEPYRSLLLPRYWNGHNWQDTVCSVPEKKVVQPPV